MTPEQREAVEALRKACRCLYLEAHAHVADDVQAKAETVIAAYDALLREQQEMVKRETDLRKCIEDDAAKVFRQDNEKLTAERDALQIKADARGNMLRYIAFVLAGDENADVQLAAERLITERDALQHELDNKFILDCQAGKLTTFDAICGYVSHLETRLAAEQAAEAKQLQWMQTACDEKFAKDALQQRVTELEELLIFKKKEDTMRKIVEDVSGEGLEKLLGDRVTLFCLNYIYTGRLAGVNEKCVLLTEAAIVYETGPFVDKVWKDAQALPREWYVATSCIESFGVLK